MGLEARQNRTVLGIEISNGVARGARLDLSRNEIVAVGVVQLGAGCCDSSGALDPSIASICLDPLLDRLHVTDRSDVEVGIAIGPRHSGVGSGPAMQSWLAGRSARLGESITVAGDLGISFAPSRAVDAAAKSIRELGLEPVRVDIAPVAAARAYGQQVDGLIRIGSGRGWHARMRNFEVLEAMETADVAHDEAMSIEELDGSITQITGFGYTEIDPRVWESVTSNLGCMAVAAGSAIGVAFDSSGNLLDGAVVGEPARVVPRPERPAPSDGGELDESTLTLKGRQRSAPAPMHRQQRRAPLPRRPERAVVDLTDAASEAEIDLTRGEAPPSDSIDQTISLKAPVALAAERSAMAAAPAPEKASARRRPTTEVQMAAMAEWDDEALDQTDPINLFSPQTQEDHLRGESTHGFGILHLLLIVIVLGIAAAGAFFFLL